MLHGVDKITGTVVIEFSFIPQPCNLFEACKVLMTFCRSVVGSVQLCVCEAYVCCGAVSKCIMLNDVPGIVHTNIATSGVDSKDHPMLS